MKENIIYLGRTIYHVDLMFNGEKIKDYVNATYPNKNNHNKCTVSLWHNGKCYDAKSFYSSVANTCIEDWVLRHYPPEREAKLTLIECDE